MEKLIEMASELGQAIANHSRTADLRKAQKIVQEDSEASQLIEQYQVQGQKITDLQKQNKPIEVEDKHKLQEIETNICNNELLKELTKCQANFVELMQKVKQTIDDQLKV
ncbi:MAG: YlbF family regulator [Phycisphaerae bacterium]|nr:YlbF family regulator [Phycisphaerae bacterium]